MRRRSGDVVPPARMRSAIPAPPETVRFLPSVPTPSGETKPETRGSSPRSATSSTDGRQRVSSATSSFRRPSGGRVGATPTGSWRGGTKQPAGRSVAARERPGKAARADPGPLPVSCGHPCGGSLATTASGLDGLWPTWCATMWFLPHTVACPLRDGSLRDRPGYIPPQAKRRAGKRREGFELRFPDLPRVRRDECLAPR